MLSRACGCDIRICFAENLTVFEPCGSSSENKIGCSFYVGILQINASVFTGSIKSILISQQFAVSDCNSISFGMKRNSLSQAFRIVFYGQIFEGDVVSAHLQRICPKSTHFVDIRVVVIGYNRSVLIFTLYFYVAGMFGYDYFFVIRAVFYKNRRWSDGIKCSDGIYGFLQGCEISVTVFIHYDFLFGIHLCSARQRCNCKNQQEYFSVFHHFST